MRKATVFSFQFKTIALVSSTALVATASLQALSNNFKNISLKESINSFIDAGTKVINGVSGLGEGSSLLYGSVYSAGITSYGIAENTVSSAKNAFSTSYSGISNGITWSTKNFGVATSFLQKAYDFIKTSTPTVGKAIWSGVTTVFNWLQNNWSKTIVTQIQKYADLSQLKNNLGLEGDGWTKVTDGFKSFFNNFVTDPKGTIYSFFYNFYRVTFKFIGPWGWSFLYVGIFQTGVNYEELWKYITQEGKLKDTLVEIMKFFKKFQNTLERMNAETRNTIVELFLKDPDKFFKILKVLNTTGNTNTTSTLFTLDPKELESILKEDPSQIQTRLAVKAVSGAIIGGAGDTVGIASHAAIKSVETIFGIDGSDSSKSIGEPVEKIITSATDTASDLVTTVASSLFSLFSPKPKEQAVQNQDKK